MHLGEFLEENHLQMKRYSETGVQFKETVRVSFHGPSRLACCSLAKSVKDLLMSIVRF